MAAKKNKAVIVRAYSGVFFGYEAARRFGEGSDSVDLVDVRQIWQWTSTGLTKPVLTCGDIALRGVGKGSKVSDSAPGVTLADVKATFACTKEAAAVLEAF